MVVSVWKLVSICFSSFALGLGTASLVVSLVNYSSLKKRDKKRHERDDDSEEAERTIAMLTEKADRLRSTLEQCKAEAGSLSVNTEDSKKSCINGLTVTIGGGTTEQQQK